MWRCIGLAVLLCCSCGSDLREDSSDDSPRTRATPDDPEEEGPTPEVVEQSPPIAWEYRWGSSGQDYVSDIAVDRDGNVYFTGMGVPAGAVAGSGGYVASLAPDGSYRWGKALAGTSWGSAVAVAPTGEILVAGTFESTLDFGGGPRVPVGQYSVYLVALTEDGKYLWDRTFGDGRINTANGLDVTPDGGVVLVGSYMGGADFGGGRRAGSDSQQVFVASYDLTGEYRWDYVGPDSGTQIPIGVDVDDVGNVTFVGHFSQEADFGGGTRVCANHQAAFVAQLDSEGDYRWDWANEDEGTSVGHAVAVDSNGGVYITGEFSGLIDFAGDRLGDSNSSLDSYVLAFGTDGRQRWGQSHGGTGAVRAFGIAAHGDIVYVTGYFGGEVSIADTTLVCSDGYDGFAFAVTTSGAHLWQRSFGGPGDEEARTIAVTDQLVYVGGRDPGHDTGPFVSMDVLVLALEQPANGSGN